MPRTYRMSADTSEKEKVIGGILTASQGGWLALGAGITAVILVSLAQVIHPAVALVIALPPGALVGGFFAFYQKEGLTLFQFITLNRKFKVKTKIMLNTLTYNKHFDDEEEVEST